MADLDRLITLNIEGPGGRNQHGEYVDGPVTAYRVWAFTDSSLNDIDLGAEGFRLSNTRRYRIRWRQDVATTPVALIQVVDEIGRVYTVTRVDEEGRQRFQTLDCVVVD